MKSRLLSRLLILAALVVLVAFVSWRVILSRSSGAWIKANYTKREYRIPMRDGVKLFTQVYAPKNTSQPLPFLIMRTPFGVIPYGEDAFRRQLGPSESFDKAGYIFVFQDVRGRFQSEGQFVDMRPDHPASGDVDESKDMSDTVDWLLKNVPANNGRAGIWGISYPGFYAAASIIDSHPAIKAASPEAPMTNLFEGDDAYHNGAFMLAEQAEVYANFFRLRSNGLDFPPSIPEHEFDSGPRDGYAFFLEHGPNLKNIATLIHNPLFDANVRHSTYDDYWQARDISQHLNGIHCAVLNVGGWFDAEDLAGTFRTYHAIGEKNPGLENLLVMGPWMHGAWARSDVTSLGPLKMNANTEAFFRDQIAFPFFEHYLKDKPAPNLPIAYVYQTGSNQWMQYREWPPSNAQQKTLYLHAKGKLSFDPPAEGEQEFDAYVSDPRQPVPYIEQSSTELAEEFMYGDQRFAAKRADVLTFATDALAEDVTVAGLVSPRLQVSSSGTDSDFDVKLIDVYPDSGPTPGYQMLVRGEPMRAKFRNSFSAPEAMTPNQVTPVNFEMPDVNHTFLRGHRIMVQIQSSWFPLSDLNPQRFEDIATAQPADFTKATQRIYHSRQQPSSLGIRVLPAR